MTRAAPTDLGLNLLLCDADQRTPTLSEDLQADAAMETKRPTRGPQPDHLRDRSGDQNSLEAQGWSVIIPEGDAGKRLLDLAAPLIQRRTEQQGAPVKVYVAPAKADQADAMSWRKRNYADGSTTEDEQPFYQLILGNLDQVALSIQQVQSASELVGRLAFDREDDYRAYIDKLLRAEDASPPQQAGRSLFYTVHDGTRATRAGYDSLITPGVSLARRKVMERKLPARAIIDSGDQTIPTRDELLQQITQEDPTVLFTLSHGAGTPRIGWKPKERQRREQGAMSFGTDGLLLGSDIRETAFLPGGIWFMLACYGAGTPSQSAYRHWLEALAKAGQYAGAASKVLDGLPKDGDPPFVAALPQAALANPSGPLAFFGHIDLAWTYSFLDLDTGSAVQRPGKFVQIVAELLKGSRCGLALQAISRAFDEVNTELTALYDREASGDVSPEAQRARLGHLWMLRQDLAGYVLLGDPAARLSVAPRRAYQASPSGSTSSSASNSASSDGANLASVLGFVPKS